MSDVSSGGEQAEEEATKEDKQQLEDEDEWQQNKNQGKTENNLLSGNKCNDKSNNYR